MPQMGMFEHELKARQKILDVKQIARIQDVFTDDMHTYMVIETTKATSLQRTIDAFYEQHSESDILQILLKLACSIITQVASILRKMRQKGVVHRLLNLQSIKLRYSESKKDYKVAMLDDFDLGVALKSQHHKIQQQIQLDGGPSFIAPEVQRGDAHDYSADIWALGQVAYQILCAPGSVERPLESIDDESANWLPDVPD